MTAREAWFGFKKPTFRTPQLACLDTGIIYRSMEKPQLNTASNASADPTPTWRIRILASDKCGLITSQHRGQTFMSWVWM